MVTYCTQYECACIIIMCSCAAWKPLDTVTGERGGGIKEGQSSSHYSVGGSF